MVDSAAGESQLDHHRRKPVQATRSEQSTSKKSCSGVSWWPPYASGFLRSRHCGGFLSGGQCTQAVLFPESFLSWNHLSGKDLDAGLYQAEGSLNLSRLGVTLRVIT